MDRTVHDHHTLYYDTRTNRLPVLYPWSNGESLFIDTGQFIGHGDLFIGHNGLFVVNNGLRSKSGLDLSQVNVQAQEPRSGSESGSG